MDLDKKLKVLSHDKKVVRITHDGFPLESLPPQGTITLHWNDGTKSTQHGTPYDYDRLLKKHEKEGKKFNVFIP